MAYFKKVHPILQVFIFAGIAAGCFMIIGTVGSLILANATGIELKTLTDPDKWDYSDPSMLTFLRGMLVIQFISLYIIPVFLFARLSDTKPADYLGLRKSNSLYIILGIVVLLVALPFVDWTGKINQSLIPESTSLGKLMRSMEEDAAKQIAFMLKGQSIKDLILNLIFVAVFAGVGEELFFRGVLQRLFIKAFKSPWIGIIITAFIFSAIHLQFYGFIPRFILGILLGLIYWYSGSLWPAIIAHFAYDALAVIVIHFNPEMADKEGVTTSFANQSLLAVVSLVLIIGIVVIMKKRSTTTYEMMYARDNIDESNPFAGSSFN
jgi:membrane protease YdiL (CAAX protease family)